jgi:selenide,water dikinase
METADDAGVYKLTDDLAIIQTVDFFTPIVDDPYIFGQIAAANALSDVYAMGGTPLTAMNVVCFPIKTLGIDVLKDILRGGLDKLNEAKTTLVGGHSVEDTEIKYGLSVAGVVHPEKVLTNAGARPGDVLILTKPLGTGIIMGVHGVTDITGFGLLGHAGEMARASEVGIVIESSRVPFFAEAQEYAGMGLVPGGARRNQDFCQQWTDLDSGISPVIVDILFDPQTSGGLLISLPERKAKELLKRLTDFGVKNAVVVGKVIGGEGGRIAVL